MKKKLLAMLEKQKSERVQLGFHFSNISKNSSHKFPLNVCVCVNTSKERRETEAKYGTNVTVDGAVEDTVLETPDCLVDKSGH